MINNRLSIIENEIDIKIESIKSELDLIKDEFKMKLEKIRHGLKKYVLVFRNYSGFFNHFLLNKTTIVSLANL